MGKSSSSTNKPWDKAQPYMLGGADTLNSVYNENAGKIQGATDQVTGLMPEVLDRYKAGNKALTGATDYNADVLGGKYLDKGNPYLQEMIDQTGGDVRNQVQAAMGTQGLRGGSDYYKMIADRVGRAGLNMRYQDYANERGLMGQASGQAPGLVAGDNERLAPVMSLLNAYNMPAEAAGDYAGSLGGLLGGYQTQSRRPSAAETAGGIGSLGVGIAALAKAGVFSDERLKTDVTRVGETDAGAILYSYKYVWGGPTQIGVLAQEIAETQPDALGPVIDGYMTVDYSRIR